MSVLGNFQLATGQAAHGGGTSDATAAAINVGLGYIPKYVRLICLDSDIFTVEYIGGDTTVNVGQGIKTTVKSASSSTSKLSSNGITVGDVVVDAATGRKEKGFTIGTACQANSKDYMWIALG